MFLVTFSVSLDVCGLPVAGPPLIPKQPLISITSLQDRKKINNPAGCSNLGLKSDTSLTNFGTS